MREIGDGGQSDRLSHCAAGHAAPVHDPAIFNADLAGLRGLERESHLAASFGSLSLGRQFADFGVLRIVDDGAFGVVEHLGFVGGVILAPAMPVEVIVGDIGDRRAVKCQRIGEVQLEGAQFHAQYVVLRIGGATRQAHAHVSGGDIAGGRRVESAGGEHFRGHLGGGGFAVGAGDADPWSRSTGALVIHTQLPCEFHLAHHGDATALGFQHERGAGVEHRGRHDVVHMVPVHVIKGVEIGLGLPLVDANHVGTAFPQYLRQRGAGHPQSGDHHCLIRYLHCSS